MNVQKIKGFGHKREMITAHFSNSSPTHTLDEYHKTQHSSNNPNTALVIGAGVAGLFTAYSLASRDITVTLIDKNAPLAGASGNLRALVSPKLTSYNNAHDNFATLAFLYAQAKYNTLNTLTNIPMFEKTGVLDRLLPTSKTDETLINLVAPYPNAFVYTKTPSPFLAYLPTAGLVNPQHLAQFVLSCSNIHFVKADINYLEYQTNYSAAYSTDGTWRADMAVICLGFESHTLHKAIFESRKIRGQVSWITDRSLVNALPHRAYKYDGYACSFDDTLLFGASFIRNTTNTDVLDDDHLFNIDKLSTALPSFVDKFTIQDLKGRASIRGQTPDYHPMVGEVETGIFVCSAMGSKGFSLAPLCAEIITALVLDEPLPIPHHLLNKLTPHRPRLQTPLPK